MSKELGEGLQAGSIPGSGRVQLVRFGPDGNPIQMFTVTSKVAREIARQLTEAAKLADQAN